MLQQEIRQHVRMAKSPIDTALKSLADHRVLSAILHVPAVLSGLSDAEYNSVRQRARVAAHPKEVGVINELNKALSDLTEGMAACRRLISERTEVRADDDGISRPP